MDLLKLGRGLSNHEHALHQFRMPARCETFHQVFEYKIGKHF